MTDPKPPRAAADITRAVPHPKAPAANFELLKMLGELGGSFVPGVSQGLSIRDMVRGVQQGSPLGVGLGALGLLPMGAIISKTGKGIKELAAAARLAKADELVKTIKEAKGITLNLSTGEKLVQGFSVGGATKTKSLKTLTPQVLLDYIDAAPKDTHLGAWLDGGKWHLDHTTVVPDLQTAVQLGIHRGEDAIGDLAKYHATNGEQGTVRLLKHRTFGEVGSHFDPGFMGTGMAGAEKIRTDRPGAIHFYGMKGKPEDMFKGAKELYTYVPDENLLDLGSDRARAMLRKAGGDPTAFERLAIKEGYKGVAEATDPEARSAYARIYKLFSKSPALQKGEAPIVIPEAFQQATAAAEAKAGRLPSSGKVLPEHALDRLAAPDVAQLDLPHPKSRGDVPAAVEPLIANLRSKYTPLVEQSIKENPRQLMWYATQPFAERFAAAGGDPSFFLKAMGPTSAATNVGKNTELASYYHYLMQNGLLDPEALKAGTLGLPEGYRHRFQTGVNKGLLDVVASGAQDPKTAQKQARYVANLLGNWQPGTLDLQVGRVIGEPGVLKKAGGELVPGVGYPAGKFISTSPSTAHYPWLERGMQEEAQRIGIPTAAYQAAGWPGQDARPFLTQLNDLLDQAARLRGVPPTKMFDLIAQGRGVLGPGAGILK